MSKKIHSIELYDSEVVEKEDGQFEEVKLNKRKYPLFLTNFSLQKGRDMGYIQTSILEDLVNAYNAMKNTESEEEASMQVLKEMQQEKAIRVIYLAYLGAAKSNAMEFDAFLQRFHLNFAETIQLYSELVQSTVQSSDNKFAKGLQDSTRPFDTKEKKQNPQSL